MPVRRPHKRGGDRGRRYDQRALLLTSRFREEDPVPPREAWSANGPLENQKLLAEREILAGDGRRPEEQGAERRPDTDHEQHGVTSASGMASEPKLYRISDGGDEVSPGGTK